MTVRVLLVAGSDSSGGAGIQADLRAVMALGGRATTAITTLTARNTRGGHATHDVPPEFVTRQMTAVLDDIGADAVKTGLLGNAAIVEAVCAVLEARPRLPTVVDPAIFATGGAPLLQTDAIAAVKRRLLPLATLLTPEVAEAALLAGMEIANEADLHHAADVLLTLGVPAVLLKGGQLAGPDVVDVLATDAGVEAFRSPRIDTRHTHGTGCTLASAIAVKLAQGLPVRAAVVHARDYLHAAMSGPGHGRGPPGHGVWMERAA